MIEQIGKPSWAANLRKWWDELFTSRTIRQLQTELINVRVDKNYQIEQLRREKAELQAKIDKLEAALMPVAYAPRPQPVIVQESKPRTFEEALAQHNQLLESQEEKPN